MVMTDLIRKILKHGFIVAIDSDGNLATWNGENSLIIWNLVDIERNIYALWKEYGVDFRGLSIQEIKKIVKQRMKM